MHLEEEHLNVTDNLDFLARQTVEGFLTGMHKSPYHGFSVEFAEHRLYNKGDSLKHIDWKLFARSDKMFVKKFEEETNLRSYIFIDTSSSMLYPRNKQIDKLTFSIYASACLMYLFKKQRDGFGLSLFNEKIDFFTHAKNSASHYNRLLSELDRVLKKKNQSVSKLTEVTEFLTLSKICSFSFSNLSAYKLNCAAKSLPFSTATILEA